MRRKKLPAVGDNWTTHDGLLKSITAVVKEREIHGPAWTLKQCGVCISMMGLMNILTRTIYD